MSVAFLNTNTPQVASGGSFSFSFSVNAGGVNVVAFANLVFDKAVGITVTNITYGGQTMTSCGPAQSISTGGGTALNVQSFYLVNPPTGSNTLAITTSGGSGDEIYANLVVFQGVSQAAPVRPGTYVGSSSSSANPSITVSSDPNDLTLTVIGDAFGISATNQTLDGIDESGPNYNFASDHATTAASSVTHNWTASATSALIGFSIQNFTTPAAAQSPNAGGTSEVMVSRIQRRPRSQFIA